MRYPPQRKAESRAKIAGAAAELFRASGIAGTGVDAVMARAGLTAGAFYAHFESKRALVRDAVALAGQRSVEKWFGRFDALRGRAWVQELLETYLGPAHRNDVAGGCILPSLGVEIARQPPEVRRHFSRRLAGLLDLLVTRANGELPLERQRVIAAVALAVGGVVLSRAVPEVAFQNEIARASRRGAAELVGLTSRGGRTSLGGASRGRASRGGRTSRRTTVSKPKKRSGRAKKKA